MSLLSDLFGESKRLTPPLAHLATARAFVFREKIIVTSVIDQWDGPDPIVLPADIDDLTLGETIFDCIKNYRHARSSEQLVSSSRDWPAFKLSGTKTVKAFEAELWDIRLRAYNLTVEYYARPYRTLRPHLQMYGTADQYLREQMGATFKQVVRGAQALQAHSIV